MATARVVNADDIVCTLEFTMRLSEWKQIRQTLRGNAKYAELQVIDEIRDLVLQLEQTLYSSQTEVE